MGIVAVVCGLVALRHVGSSQTRDWTCVPCNERWILIYCATRGSPKLYILPTASTFWPSLVLLCPWPLSGATGHTVRVLWECSFGGAPELFFFLHGLMDCFSNCGSKTVGFQDYCRAWERVQSKLMYLSALERGNNQVWQLMLSSVIRKTWIWALPLNSQVTLRKSLNLLKSVSSFVKRG